MAPAATETPVQEVSRTKAKRASLAFLEEPSALCNDPKSVQERNEKREAARSSMIAKGGKIRVIQDDNETSAITKNIYFVAGVGIMCVLNLIVIGTEVDFGCVDFDKGWLNCNIDDRFTWYLIENFFAFAFLVEMTLRISCGPRLYFLGDSIHNPWGVHVANCADFLIVFLRCIDTWILQPAGAPTVLKLLSCFRIFHLSELIRRADVSTFREVWVILHGIFQSSRVVFWTLVVLFMILYLCAIVMTSTVINEGEPEYYDYSLSAWHEKPWTIHDYWGTVPRSVMSLFQIVTLDHWSSTLVRPLIEHKPIYALLFIPFLVITVLSLLNVIVAVIVETSLASAAVQKDKAAREEAKTRARIMESLQNILQAADTDGSGEIDRHELKKAYNHSYVRDRLKVLQLDYSDLFQLFDLLDEEKKGSINTEQFFRGCTRLRGLAKASDLHHLSMDFNRYTQWCTELADDNEEINDRLAELLSDIEGLDREVVRGKYDSEDPVLQARRLRHKRVGDGEIMERHLAHAAQRDQHGRAASKNSHSSQYSQFSRRSKTSLMGNMLNKTNIGIDFNSVSTNMGMARRPSFADSYESELLKHDHAHAKHKAWEGGDSEGMKQRKPFRDQ